MRLCVLLIVLCQMATCQAQLTGSGKVSASGSMKGHKKTIVSIAVTPPSPNQILNGVTGFTATATYNDGTTQNISTSVSWASSSPSIGVLQGVTTAEQVLCASAGTTAVSATKNGINGNSVLTCSAPVTPSLVSVAITPGNPSIYNSQSIGLTATGTYSDSSTQNVTAAATWASSAPSVGTVGPLTTTESANCLSSGTSSISATIGSIIGTTTLSCAAPPVTLSTITVAPTTPTAYTGSSVAFTATGHYSDGSTQNLTATSTWASTVTSVATVGPLTTTESGNCLAAGSSTISATFGAVSGSTMLICQQQVVTPTLVSIAITPANPTQYNGSSDSFTATGTYSDGSTQNLTASATWGSTNTAVATLGALTTIQTVNCVTTGTSTISATVSAISGTTTQTCQAPPVTLMSIAVTPALPTQYIGSSVGFTATGTYSDGSTQNITSGAAWTSGTPAVATVGGASIPQTVNCLTAGTSVITATQGAVSGNTTLTCQATGSSSGCGTDASGNPTLNDQCGVSGTSPYTGEGGSANLTAWCGGSLPGSCTAISTCNPTLTGGTFGSHTKYYLSADLNCGAGSLAIQPARYTDVNLNGHTVTGYLYWNLGFLRGFHLFNGTINCNVPYGPVYACVDFENIDGGFTQGGGDQILLHHLKPSNASTISWTMRVTGALTTTGAWTEYPITAYNNTLQSVPETTSGRQHAGMYSETHPVNYYNNLGDVGATGQASATQLLETYGKQAFAFTDFIHNNRLTCELFNVSGGDSCRPILCDGSVCHIQQNDIAATNNRCMRLRDAVGAEVDHNYCHGIVSANGFAGVGVHTGDNDINSGLGGDLNQNIHNNTFELGAGGGGILMLGQQGVTEETNSFPCAASGCTGAQTVNLQNQTRSFVYPVAVNATAKTITQTSNGSNSFLLGPAVLPGSVITFAGFANGGNNNTFTVTAVNQLQITVSDPGNLLVSETSNAATYVGVTTANLYNSTIGASVPLNVTLLQAGPTVTLNYCPSPPVLVAAGGGTLHVVGGPCP